jgi:histone acetyltransferase (RNA polymerase elongator complex component)
MANLMIICGPQAVGKMTVAKAIKEKIGWAVSTNHDSLEIPARIFGWGTPSFKELRNMMRKEIFDLSIKNDVDLIFTYIVDFNDENDVKYVKDLKEKYEKNGGKFYFVELETNLEERLKRNVTEERLLEKPTKRDIERSNKELVDSMYKYRMNSNEGELDFENYIRIDNTNLSPEEVANKVIKQFKL